MSKYIRNWKPKPVRSDTGKIHWRDVKPRPSSEPKCVPPPGVAEIAARLCIRLGEISASTLGKALRDRGHKWYDKPIPNFKAGEYLADLCKRGIFKRTSIYRGRKFYHLVDVVGVREVLKWDRRSGRIAGGG